MENFSIDITEGCNKDIKNTAEYISMIFLYDDLANKVALELFADIKKISYLAPMFSLCENEQLSAKGIRKYRVKKINRINRDVGLIGTDLNIFYTKKT